MSTTRATTNAAIVAAVNAATARWPRSSDQPTSRRRTVNAMKHPQLVLAGLICLSVASCSGPAPSATTAGSTTSPPGQTQSATTPAAGAPAESSAAAPRKPARAVPSPSPTSPSLSPNPTAPKRVTPPSRPPAPVLPAPMMPAPVMPPPATTFTISVSIENQLIRSMTGALVSGSGSVTSSPAGVNCFSGQVGTVFCKPASFSIGQTVTLDAEPGADVGMMGGTTATEFLGWNGAAAPCGVSRLCKITEMVPGTFSVGAVFAPR